MPGMEPTEHAPLALALQSHLTERGSQAQLARDLNVRPSTLNGWVKGTRAPDLADIVKIEQALDLKAGTLTVYVGFIPVDTTNVDMTSPEQAIIADPTLDGRDKRMLLDMLARFRGESKATS